MKYFFSFLKFPKPIKKVRYCLIISVSGKLFELNNTFVPSIKSTHYMYKKCRPYLVVQVEAYHEILTFHHSTAVSMLFENCTPRNICQIKNVLLFFHLLWHYVEMGPILNSKYHRKGIFFRSLKHGSKINILKGRVFASLFFFFFFLLKDN